MIRKSTPIYRKTLIVLDSRSTSRQDDSPDAIEKSSIVNAPGLRFWDAGADLSLTETSSLDLKSVFTQVPMAWEWELESDYKELGEALREMRELCDDDEWGIESPVFVVACYVASQLMDYAIPAPRIFTHGAKSVVFNWTNGVDNAYLTISSDRVSALVSSPDQIKLRRDLDPAKLMDPSAAFYSLKAALADTSVGLLECGVSEEFEELVI